ncbi:MAG: hypothetical protein ACPGWR_18035 [Ardenticatenaceae bacterium]
MNRFVLFTVLHAILAILYWLYVGSALYDLWFPPVGATDATNVAWRLIGSAIYFAPVALLLAGLQFWWNRRPPQLEGIIKTLAYALVWGQLIVVLLNGLFFLS